MDTINVAVVTDNNYLMPLCVMLTSLFENNKDINIDIHVLYFQLNKINRVTISKIAKKYNSDVKFHKVNISKIKKYFKDFGHVSKTTYIKFYIPKVIRKINKILYLDSDIIINGSLTHLLNIDIGDKIIGAITEYSDSRIKDLEYDITDGYFNAGVLLINISKWNESNIGDKLIKYVKNNQNKLVYWDQDAFNAVLHADWYRVPIIYNFQTLMYLDRNKFLKNKEPIIIHYTTDAKPWNLRCNHPLRDEFWKYIKLTKWKNYKMKDISLKNLIYHYMPLKLDLKLSAFIRKVQGRE